MRTFIILVLILLIASPCEALEPATVIFNYNAPGTIKLKYTGIKRVILDEARDLLENEWKRDANLLFKTGSISISQYKLSLQQLRFVKGQYGLNDNWWTRRWYESFTIQNGGAPRRQTYIVGRVGDIINLGIAKVDENFRFKFKEYDTDITNEWHFKFKPRLVGDTKYIISRASISFIFEYSKRRRRQLSISLRLGYNRKLREFITLEIELLSL